MPDHSAPSLMRINFFIPRSALPRPHMTWENGLTQVEPVKLQWTLILGPWVKLENGGSV
jgi:hypothetical protein